MVISSLPQPLDLNMPPAVTVGDLKREVQTKLGQGLDPDQVLVLDNQVLSNSMRVRSVYANIYIWDIYMITNNGVRTFK